MGRSGWPLPPEWVVWNLGKGMEDMGLFLSPGIGGIRQCLGVPDPLAGPIELSRGDERL